MQNISALLKIVGSKDDGGDMFVNARGSGLDVARRRSGGALLQTSVII